MSSKRKAGDAVVGQAKRLASGVATPTSGRSSGISSDDDFEEPSLSSDEEYEEASRLADRFSGKMQKAAPPKKPIQSTSTTNLFGNGTRDFSHLELKPDHMQRPMFIDPVNFHIIVESFAPTFKQAEDFLINVAEPQSRVSRIHEYTMTSNSLYAAVSVGLTTQDIITRLDYFSKTPLPDQLVNFIYQSTKAYGQARLVLKHNKFFVESSDPAILQTLLRDPEIRGYRADDQSEFTVEAAPQMGALYIPGTKLAAGAKQADGAAQVRPENGEGDEAAEQDDMMAKLLDEDDDDEVPDQVHAFEVKAPSIQALRKRCEMIDYPLTEEYDFRNDTTNANLEIDLKPAAQIRPYQEQALSKMFGNGRARSGIIVLPCGAGKTLVGITAACTVKKGIIVLCTSTMSVTQWRNEFLNWTNINPDDIATFTRHEKQRFPNNTGVLITNYTMISMGRGEEDENDSSKGKKKNGQEGDKRRMAHDTKKVIDFIRNREWGLMILDEVHVVPAEMFSKVTYRVKAHTKLGLTATLLREDDKISELNFLIGPKLFEANWQELSEQGHIARVQCAEVWCPMTADFYSEYLRAKTPQKRLLLSTMNPRKFQACQYLIDYHEKRGDKIIVFSDNVYALKAYCDKMGKLRIDGKTSDNERLQTLENFKYGNETWAAALFLSKIGDTSLDIPEATCLIQISSHYGSRRQEAQRLGRILRAKRRNDEGFNAFFYSLVSKDTQEMYYAAKRQAFLVDQGYAFKVITHLTGIDSLPGLAFSTKREQKELLTAVAVNASNDDAEAEKIEDDVWGGRISKRAGGTAKGYKRQGATLGELSGAGNMMYVEQNKKRTKRDMKQQNKSIAKFKRDAKRKNDAYKDFNK